MSLNPDIRSEVETPTNLFYVISEGYAADHLFSWFSKSLNKHPEVFALLAHEGSRPKYLKERTRGERPNIINFSEFLHDMGMTFGSIGDCYSFRAHHLFELNQSEKFKNVPKLYLIRNPLIWIYFYQQWRSSNMRMGSGKTNPLEWEWNVANHIYFKQLNLKPYEKDDVNIWSFYQGLQLIDLYCHGFISDHYRVEKIEEIFGKKKKFKEIFEFLTKIKCSESFIQNVFENKKKLYKGEKKLPTSEENILDIWEDWQFDAFFKILQPKSINILKTFYEKEIPENTLKINYHPQKKKSIFVSSQLKSGTHLLREILKGLTKMNYHEPFKNDKEPANNHEFHNYNNYSWIDFPKNTFFSWHNIINSETSSLLNSSRTANIFLTRNIYEILFSFYNHLKFDADKSINRSIGDSSCFFEHGTEAAIYNLINGYGSADFNFFGMKVVIEQLKSYCDFLKSTTAFFLTYNDLINHKEMLCKNLSAYLGVDLTTIDLEEILKKTSREKMGFNNPHITKQREKRLKDFKKHLHNGHIAALNYLIYSVFRNDNVSINFCNKLGLLDISSMK